MPITHLLYIEDDPEIGEWVSSNLEARGYAVTWLKHGDQAVEKAADCHLVILDVMLPGLDGFTIGGRLKQKYPELPVLMLSARTSIDDKLQGLKFADDYLTKPFHPDELAARIEVLLRRSGGIADPAPLRIKHLLVYEKENRIINQDTNEEIVLTGKQFHIYTHSFRFAQGTKRNEIRQP